MSLADSYLALLGPRRPSPYRRTCLIASDMVTTHCVGNPWRARYPALLDDEAQREVSASGFVGAFLEFLRRMLTCPPIQDIKQQKYKSYWMRTSFGPSHCFCSG